MNGAWVSAFGRADAVLMAEARGRVVYGGSSASAMGLRMRITRGL